MRRSFLKVFSLGAAAVAAACGSPARVPVSAETGVHPVIPRPKESLIPVINVVKAKRWTDDATPVAGEGLAVRAFARELNHPRSLYVLPNGDVLVAETNAPKRPDDGKGIKGFFFRYFQAQAGGAGRIDEKAKSEYLAAAFSDSIAIYMLSLCLDVDYYELRERDYALLAPPALAERLKKIAELFPPNPGFQFNIFYKRRA